MIQKWIKDRLAAELPDLEWSMDYKTGQDNTGVVYNESPGDPTNDDFRLMFPTYMIEIESSRIDDAENWAWKVFDSLDKQRQTRTTIGNSEFEIIFIQAIPPLPLGIESRRISYSINLNATVRRVNVLQN